MRHQKNTCKLGRTGSHRRCLFANMTKELIDKGRITTTLSKAKYLRRTAENMITLAKKGTLASRRHAMSDLMIRFNPLTPKERRAAKEGNESSFNVDRRVIKHLFDVLGPRFQNRNGGYTRITKSRTRQGDGAQTCILEYLND